MKPFEPQAFGKYFLVDKIAVGGMAEIFKAKSFSHGGFEKLQVIKRILSHLSDNLEFIEMFIDEAKISVELQHPNIVQIYDFGKILDNYFIAMECVEGKDVKGILRKLAERRKLLPTEFAVYIAHEMCKGLDYAHKKTDIRGQSMGIIHRDISPSNILVSYTGQVKVADFGIAKAEKSIYNTKDGVLKGKFEYMSPEQALGKDLDPRSDVFAAGIILHEMLTGRRLFKTDSEIKTLEKIKTGDYKRPSELNPRIPARLDEVVMKALATDRDERFADAKQLQSALLEFMYPSTPDLVRESLQHFIEELFVEEIAFERDRLEVASKAAQELWEAADEIDLDDDWQPGKSILTGTLQTKAAIGGTLLFALMALLLAGGVVTYFVIKGPKIIREVVEVQAPDPTVGSVQLKIQPEEVNAALYLDDELVAEGAQVLTFDQVPPGKDVTVLLVAEGYKEWTDTLNIEAGQRLVMKVKLKEGGDTKAPVEDPGPKEVTPVETPAVDTTPAQPEAVVASVAISSDPRGAQVFIAGQLVGRTPMTWKEGTAGTGYTVELRKDGYASASKSFTFPAEGSASVSASLSAAATDPGKVSVNVSKGWAYIYVDGKKLDDTTPLFNYKLDAGPHTIKVESPATGFSETKQITVVSGETRQVNFDAQ